MFLESGIISVGEERVVVAVDDANAAVVLHDFLLMLERR